MRIAHPWRIAPKIFQRVKPPFLGVENVNQHVIVVDHQPLAGWDSFRRKRGQAKFLVQTFSNPRTNGFEMRFGGSRANHEKVGKRRQAPQVKNDDIFGLLVLG